MPPEAITVAGGRVVGPLGIEQADVTIRGGVIASVQAATDEGEVLDATGLLVAPGFVDLQCNGGYGIDLATEPERLWELAALLPRYGPTAFLPTIVSSPPAVVDRALSAIAQRPSGFQGAEPLGLHLEGPMLNPSRRGAHSEQHLRAPRPALIDGWSKATGVAMVTLAPELPGALDVAAALHKRGVVVSAGHTDATTTELIAGLDAGISMVTHLFNAMAPFAHREPGPIGVALADKRVTAGLIVDGLHVHPITVAAAWAALAPDRLAVVTDAVAALGAGAVGPPGVRTPSGRLAGSVVSMDEAVRNLVSFAGCTPADAIACASTTPARLIGASSKGKVAPGYDADLVLLTPELHVAATIIGGAVFQH
ncbi:MAG TPA: N-acetylglucosamine-6-phosphate deacetylase [Acidimicrobiales bacterium]|nr:N-acetylglucosamine-6-phosphate deacetylase [Acidimicrobiales bacterium]